MPAAHNVDLDRDTGLTYCMKRGIAVWSAVIGLPKAYVDSA